VKKDRFLPWYVATRSCREKLIKIIGPHRPAQKEEVKNFLVCQLDHRAHGSRHEEIADPSLRHGAFVAGANKEGYHVKGVSAAEHFADAEFVDIHTATAGDLCCQCGKPLRIERVIEIGNIFKLGTNIPFPSGELS